jgi:hypothetical protein
VPDGEAVPDFTSFNPGYDHFLMVRSASSRVSNHETTSAAILTRDTAVAYRITREVIDLAAACFDSLSAD